MMFTNAIPLLITGACMFVSIWLHWRKPNQFWKPTLLSGVVTACIATCVFFLLHNGADAERAEQTVSGLVLAVAFIAGSGFAYGTLISAFIGYLLKVAPSFFD